mmetsp:Transcript_97795/g.188643  ORF Transcript_97795/g.188643 Transcript_97795/m.188643 type:complete len:204 (+) Transcript_97795:62-673(+)
MLAADTSKTWTEEQFEHLLWYTTSNPTPVGELERNFGQQYNPYELFSAKNDPSNATESSNANSQGAREEEEEVIRLDVLIAYVEEEIADKELCVRAADALRGDGPFADSLLAGNGVYGQEAVDRYVFQLVQKLKEFPYLRLLGGREAGTWVRDELVAPCFTGRWKFYSNQKLRGFDLPALVKTLTSENGLLDRLYYAKRTICV